ncbi:MAG TPA: cytochrome c oxidase subunit II [Gemmatimonadaceae bacterium]|nr:cytochrome c oxidase subunit II [Gemmatimonadaceae bacterium]
MMTLGLCPQVRAVYTQNPSIFVTASPDASRIAVLGWVMTIIAAAVFVLVVGLIVAGIARRWRSPLPDGVPLPVSENGWLLGGGLVMPIIILGGVFIASLAVMGATKSNRKPYVDIRVIGHQWWWEVRYPDQGVVTANEIHVPVGLPVRINVSTADVIHSFWVPNINGKVDLITGHLNDIWFQASKAGVYRGECAEYCGKQHAHMDFSVVAQSKGEFDAWMAHERAPAASPGDSITATGQQLFLNHACVYCHTVRGTPATGQVAPDLTHVGSRLTLAGGAIPNSPGYLGGWILNPDRIKPGTTMPPVPMDGASLNAIVAYLESLK